MSKFDTNFSPELTCANNDPDVDARPPENAPRSSALITTTSDVTIEVTDDTQKCPREVESFTKNRAIFTSKCLENYKNVDFDSFGGFLKTCLMCERVRGDNVNVYMFRNLEAFCSNDCRNKYIEAEEKEQRYALDSTVSEAFMSSFTK